MPKYVKLYAKMIVYEKVFNHKYYGPSRRHGKECNHYSTFEFRNQSKLKERKTRNFLPGVKRKMVRDFSNSALCTSMKIQQKRKERGKRKEQPCNYHQPKSHFSSIQRKWKERGKKVQPLTIISQNHFPPDNMSPSRSEKIT